jgi:DinB superfamily
MITVDEYLAYCDRALDAYTEIVTRLGDDLVNARPDGVPGANSAFALVTHVDGMAARWGRTVNRGIVVPRDRDAEFTATGSVAEAVALVEAARARLHDDARAASPREQPANPATREDGSTDDATQGDVLLHVYEELAQHLGQLEVTRDVLLAQRAGTA